MAFFPDPPAPAPAARPEPEQIASPGPLGGPSHGYRGAVIDCQKGGHVCVLKMPDHPLHGCGFGALGTITPLVNLWLNERRLSRYTRAVKPMAKRQE